ncbi:hypothetical protein [Anaerosacchariphilus polymeriproducens]|uniref:Uncharacterized protein n=1 Tax=Anaerosacchariphilus polymeriproducens TaxID=1812858 RepID=A0A371AWP8_9FIRM|nr:hypothetical protein [Anaerosacchariphilus polymeriproducens]RDU23997.1 hypothetical protein DWV06_06810 [Anaerosacchariphilus polymeriproducens]
MVVNEEEIVMLMIMAYKGMYPSLRGIPSILPFGVNNVLKRKNQIGMDKVAEKVKKKFTSQDLWWGKEKFEKIIMSVAVHKLQIAFKNGEGYLKSFFQSEYGYAFLEFKERGLFEIRVVNNKEEWMEELKEFSKAFFKNYISEMKHTEIEKHLKESEARICLKKFINNKSVYETIFLSKVEGKIPYKKVNKKLLHEKTISENVIDINNINEFLKKEIILQGDN